MTISTTASSTTVVLIAAQTVVPFSFIADAASDITVQTTNTSTGASTTLTSSQYTVTLNSATTGQLWGVGGYVTLNSAPGVGYTCTIARTLPLQQLISIQNQGDFAPQVTEQALDTLCMEIQQVSARGGAYRGVWATDVIYNFGDIVQDGINGAYTNNLYVCAIANTSGTWATDLAAGDWSLALNVQTINVGGTYLPLAGGTISGNLSVTGALSANGTVSGTGFSTYLASPPSIGGTAAAAGAFTTLSASGTISGAGFTTYLASPPAIGGTAAAAGAFTTLSAATSLKLNGSAVIDKVNVQKFTSSGTYTPTTGAVYAIVKVQAAGGNGGGVSSGTASGGGAGGYAEYFYTSPSSQTVTIGSVGSNTTFGSIVTCVYGNNGVSGGSSAGAGGTGGSASGGNIVNISGATGGGSWGGSPAWSGYGANSLLGIGGNMLSSSSAGTSGFGYGSGGSGGFNNTTGGTGGPGIIIITEFISA